MTTRRSKKFSPEVRERAVRMLHWVRQAQRDQGLRVGPTSEDRERIKALEREVRGLRKAITYFAQCPA